MAIYVFSLPENKASGIMFSVSLPVFLSLITSQQIQWFLRKSVWTCIIFAEAATIPAAVPPECRISETEVKYNGSQWTTMTGQPCFPWVYAASVIHSLKNDQLFEDGSVVAALNYCRNPTNDTKGPFCYVHDSDTNLIRPEYCHPRKCRSSGRN